MEAIKRVIPLMVVIMLFSGIVSFGQEQYDAFHVDESEAQEYKIKEDDTAYKIFSGVYPELFAKGLDIYEIVSRAQEDTAYLVESDKLMQIRYKSSSEVLTASISCLARSCLSQICVMAQDHGLLFESNTRVINTYIFHEMWGLSVYFVTDKGNYVMYKESIVSEPIYLMPDSVYRECAAGMVNFISSTEGGTCPSYAYFADISEYQIYPERDPIPPTEEEDMPKTEEKTQIPDSDKEEQDDTPDAPMTEQSKEKQNGSEVVLVAIISAGVPTVVLGTLLLIAVLKKRNK